MMAAIMKRVAVPLALVLIGFAFALLATPAAAQHRLHRHQHPGYVGPVPEGHLYVTPGGNLYVAPYRAPSVAHPYGGEWRVDTPQGSTSGTYRAERPGPYRNGFEGTTPRCQRFFC
jgi:hypothetical protein